MPIGSRARGASAWEDPAGPELLNNNKAEQIKEAGAERQRSITQALWTSIHTLVSMFLIWETQNILEVGGKRSD